jgi:hypothetical protein
MTSTQGSKVKYNYRHEMARHELCNTGKARDNIRVCGLAGNWLTSRGMDNVDNPD